MKRDEDEMKKLIAEKSDFLLKLAYMDGSELKRVEIEKEKNEVRNGQVYRAVVQKRASGLQAYFLDLKTCEQGFLQSRKNYKNGETVLVQVKKTSIGSKQPKLTEELSFSGRYAVYLPFGKGVSISNKIGEDKRLKAISETLEKKYSKEGIIFRTNSVHADYTEIEEDILQQKRIFEKVLNTNKAGLLYEKNFVERFFSTFFEQEVDEVVANDKEMMSQIKTEFQKRDLHPRFRLTSERNFDVLGIDVTKLMQKRYRFGNLEIVVETTEAFTAIDINSGFQNRHLFLDDMSLQVNLQACGHIVDLIILKDISGVILIDFIDMKKDEYRNQLLKELKREFIRDHKKVSVLNITSLGIVQVIRKREKQNIVEEFTRNCPHCQGTGRTTDLIMEMDKLQGEVERFLFHRSVEEGALQLHLPSRLKEETENIRKSWEDKYCRKLVFHYGDEDSPIEIIERRG